MTTTQGPHRWPNPVIDAAYALADSRQMCCREDLTLLVDVVRDLPTHPRVVQLGAGSGTMGLAILGARDDVTLWSVDTDQQALNWELQALENAEVDLQRQYSPRYLQVNDESALVGERWKGVTLIDLLLIDADHSYKGVMADMRAWSAHSELIFLHDYDGSTAPEQYPGVRQAADEFFGADTPPLHKAGWSAVFRSPWNTHRSSH